MKLSNNVTHLHPTNCIVYPLMSLVSSETRWAPPYMLSCSRSCPCPQGLLCAKLVCTSSIRDPKKLSHNNVIEVSELNPGLPSNNFIPTLQTLPDRYTLTPSAISWKWYRPLKALEGSSLMSASIAMSGLSLAFWLSHSRPLRPISFLIQSLTASMVGKVGIKKSIIWSFRKALLLSGRTSSLESPPLMHVQCFNVLVAEAIPEPLVLRVSQVEACFQCNSEFHI